MALAKLLKPDKTPPTPLEEEIAATLVDLQSHEDLSESVKMLYFCGAKVNQTADSISAIGILNWP